jgi:peptide/nickel transport system permease protein
MARFLLKRMVVMAMTMFVVSLAVFATLELVPGNVAVKVLGQYSTAEQQRFWLEAHGYLDPAWRRYLRWLGNAVTGEFGQSLRYNAPVADVLWPRLANTAILGGVAFAAMIPLSLLLGVMAGLRAGRPSDRAITFLSVVTTSVPEFASAVFLSSLFVFALGWLPGTSGMTGGFEWRQLVLPAAVLVLYDFGYVARVTRASVIDVMVQPYIRTAVLRGLPYRTVVMRHVLRNALLAPVTVILLHVNWLLSGVVVVEAFFAYKGFGALLLEAALFQDIYVVEACALVAVAVAVGSQTLADIAYVWLNPRIRFG